VYPAPARTLEPGGDVRETLLALLASPNVASRLPLFQQYDWLVQSRTVRRPGDADAAVLLLPGGGALAAAIDGNGRRVACDPYTGTVETLLECAANLACVGAEPLGATNNLNFGNPEKPHIAWQLTEAVRGLGDACRALGIPIVGGNVSLYNEGDAGPIYPTPVVGLVGELPDAARAGRLGFAHPGDAIAAVGAFRGDLRGSELSKLWGEPLAGGLPAVDVPVHADTLARVRDAVRAGELSSAHDVAAGGWLVAAAESCLAGGIGAELAVPEGHDALDRLFGEGAGGFVVSGPEDVVARLGVVVGRVGGDALTLRAGEGGIAAWRLDELAAANSALGPLFP
jgi:phosphoribosylformylglycinamidine synthase